MFTDDEILRARTLIAEAIGIDSHVDTIQRVLVMGQDLGKRSPAGHVDIPRVRESGMRALFFALWAPVYFPGAEAVRRTLDLRDAMQQVLDANAAQIELATTAAEIVRIASADKIAAFLTIEGGHQIADDLRVLRVYYQLGIRSMTLTHSRNNNWADASTDAPAHNGLTEFGKEVVREMNRLGMLIDISHVSDKTFYDTLAVTQKPVIVSHSSMRAISDVPRNVTDDMLRALAINRGVIGINFGEGFVNPRDREALQADIHTETHRTARLPERRLTSTRLRTCGSYSGPGSKYLRRWMTSLITSIALLRSRGSITSASAAISTGSRAPRPGSRIFRECPPSWQRC